MATPFVSCRCTSEPGLANEWKIMGFFLNSSRRSICSYKTNYFLWKRNENIWQKYLQVFYLFFFKYILGIIKICSSLKRNRKSRWLYWKPSVLSAFYDAWNLVHSNFFCLSFLPFEAVLEANHEVRNIYLLQWKNLTKSSYLQRYLLGNPSLVQ